MNQQTQIDERLQSWVDAGLIDLALKARILEFEAGRESRKALQWPVLLAMVFGAILFAAGITLFVAAHWSELSPAIRFTLVLLMVGILHLAGALFATRFRTLSIALHAMGTATLGAAIFLTAQIFNLHENWATGVLLWAVGAACGYVLLRTWSQAAMLALLAPAWLIGQWVIATERLQGGGRPVAIGLITVAICYLSARIGDQESTVRRALVWIGGLAVLPCVGVGIGIASTEGNPFRYRYAENASLPYGMLLVGWTVALGAPLVLAWILRGFDAWINLAWAAWTCALVVSASNLIGSQENSYHRSLGATLIVYALCGLGSVGLVAWGLREKRKERLNLGVAGFAISVLFFYFDSFMDKLGRSASLLLLGLVCLAGGYALEMIRRRLMTRLEARQ